MKKRRTQRLCDIEGCGRTHYARGFCTHHWFRFNKQGADFDRSLIRPLGGRIGSENFNWKGGIVTDKRSGRVLIYSLGHPHPSYCGSHVYRYRLVIEKHLGRYLRPEEIVHHKNGDCSDDRLENLELLPNQAEHARIHFTKRNRTKKGCLV